ncbi:MULTISPECIES: pentapeptide repeat-containing protein [unclassified Frankia]|uniref:pentapeptide repeat-containing protein n=1 Tax=unclassified Frankia TaxID=2632575 RepID=UPI001365472C|nr:MULTISPECIES: pentapeptide repeat-containing protein [unclassified Frankia]
MRVPSIDEDDLLETSVLFRGKFDHRLALLAGDQSGVRGEGSISRSVVRANLTDAAFDYLEAADTVVRDSDLSNGVIERFTARRVEFQGCRMTGWRGTFKLADDVAFLNCRLDYSILDFQRVSGTILFKECQLGETVIRGRLDGSVFAECDLSGVEFEASSAAGCDLSTSRLSGVRGLSALRGARISYDQVFAAAEALLAEFGIEVID